MPVIRVKTMERAVLLTDIRTLASVHVDSVEGIARSVRVNNEFLLLKSSPYSSFLSTGDLFRPENAEL